MRTRAALAIVIALTSSLIFSIPSAAVATGAIADRAAAPATRASGERPPPKPNLETPATEATTPGLTSEAADNNGLPVFRIDSGFDLDQYLFRDASPLNFSVDVPESYGPVASNGAPAPGNALYGKVGLLTLRVYDVDEAQGEVDHVYVNGTRVVGQLSGANEQWATDTFTIPTSLLRLPTTSNPSGTNSFYVDIDVTNAGWAVQVDWAELRPIDAFNGVPPMAFVHGITADGSAMTAFKDYFVNAQPELRSGRAITPSLTRNGSIKANADLLARAVQTLVASEPAKRIDIAAHSMGGLDSRLYAFEHPGRVRKLTMVGTPNGGSALADLTCEYQHTPWWESLPTAVLALYTLRWGNCFDSNSGVYQLQSRFVQNVFNKQVPDLPSVTYATIAGQTTGPGSIFLSGADDGVVAVDSVRYLDKNLSSHSGLHTSLAPTYPREHNELIQSGSPAFKRALCQTYGVTLSQCVGYSGKSPLTERSERPDRTVTMPYQGAGGPGDTVPAGSTRTYALTIPTGQPGALIISPESSDVQLSITGTSLVSMELLGSPAYAGEFTGSQTLTVTNTSAHPQSFISLLLASSPRSLTVDVPDVAPAGGSVQIRATLTGTISGDAPQYSLTNASGAVLSSGPLVSAGALWSASVTLPTAGGYSANVWVTGPQPRSAAAPILASAGGNVGASIQQSVVGDEDADGMYDWLDVDVPVTVSSSGSYRLAGQLLDGQGAVVSTAGTTATLAAGASSMTLRFDGRSINASQRSGPWHLAEVALSDSALTPIDIKSSLGSVTPDDFNAYEHDVVTVDSFSDAGVDVNSDGKFEELDLSMRVNVDVGGSYAINGKLVAPDGTEVARGQLNRTLLQGSNNLTLPFDGTSIGAVGKDGPYTLRDLAIYPESTPAAGVAFVDSYTTRTYLSSQFPGSDSPPTADFTASTSGQTVLLDAATSSDDHGIVSYEWTFGDGTMGSGSTTQHTYATAGTYTVTLTVTDTAGQRASTSADVSVASGATFSKISAGQSHTCAVTPSGGVQCWGDNSLGQLGDGTTNDSARPVPVVGLSSGVSAVWAGANHTCANQNGAMKCWGSNSSGQLGDKTTVNRRMPVQVAGFTSGTYAITAGDAFSCAVTAAKATKCWGLTFGTAPVTITGASGAIQITAGAAHACVVLGSRAAKCWGNNSSGQLGDGTKTYRTSAVQVKTLTSGVAGIWAGKFHTCAHASSGWAKCWGAGANGQLGNGTLTTKLTPVTVSGMSTGVVGLRGGLSFTCAVKSGRDVWCWGRNTNGQLGNGTTTQSNVPSRVSGFTGGTGGMLAAGTAHACILNQATAQASCWGTNDQGQLGDGTLVQRLTPTPVVP